MYTWHDKYDKYCMIRYLLAPPLPFLDGLAGPTHAIQDMSMIIVHPWYDKYDKYVHMVGEV